jgi:hypothetical protein
LFITPIFIVALRLIFILIKVLFVTGIVFLAAPLLSETVLEASSVDLLRGLPIAARFGTCVVLSLGIVLVFILAKVTSVVLAKSAIVAWLLFLGRIIGCVPLLPSGVTLTTVIVLFLSSI